jgi:hypothetical protein
MVSFIPTIIHRCDEPERVVDVHRLPGTKTHHRQLDRPLRRYFDLARAHNLAVPISYLGKRNSVCPCTDPSIVLAGRSLRPLWTITRTLKGIMVES